MKNINDIINKYQTSLPNFDFPEQEREFISLKELYKSNGDKPYTLQAIFINDKSKFGDAPVFYIDGYMVNIPQHELVMAQEARQDDEFVEAVNNGLIGFKPYEFQNKQKQTGYGVELVNMQDELGF